MWSTLLLPLLLLHFTMLHATLALATASGGLTVIEGASTSSSSTTSSSTRGSSTNSPHSSSIMTVSNTPLVAGPGQRKRHRKRNSSWYDYRNYNENITALEWLNPCGGSYYTTQESERRRAQRPKQAFNHLKRAAGTEYRLLNNSQVLHSIDISDMQMWKLHNSNYKFLPKLKVNSTIALKRWYRNMQTYVASFAYLRRVQVNWDRHELKRESAVAKELKLLLLSSRSILCELETAVNHTYPLAAPSRANGQQRRMQQLPQISRTDMNKRLKLSSKRRTRTGNEADVTDMRFVKHYYYEFLRTMWKLLRRDSKRARQQPRLQRQRRLQQRPFQPQQRQYLQQQQQQQQQQWLQQSLAAAGNRKEFNEVSKPLLDASGRRGKRQQPHSTAAASASASASASTSMLVATQRQKRRVQRT